MSVSEIMSMLYEKRILTPGEYRTTDFAAVTGEERGIWNRSMVLRMLGDERYTGTYVIGKQSVVEVGSSRTRQNPESEWVKIPNHHPAIISKELFDEVGAKLLHFKCPKNPREYPLRGKVICGCCRHAMQLIPRKVRAFQCRHTLTVGNTECHRQEIGEIELEELLYTIIEKQAQVILNIDRLDDTSGFQIKDAEQSEYGKLIEKCRDDKQSLYEKLILGELDAAEYKAEKAKVDAELDSLKNALERLTAETKAITTAKSADNELRSLAGTAVSESKLTRPLVDALIDKVYVYPGNRVEIIWKSADFAANIKEVSENV
ncbi:hypothetical protein FACS18949_06030 [Clostridia bacterium]|nr:hypothetical protein FACS18949_06030 [Clostridia bacterium]